MVWAVKRRSSSRPACPIGAKVIHSKERLTRRTAFLLLPGEIPDTDHRSPSCLALLRVAVHAYCQCLAAYLALMQHGSFLKASGFDALRVPEGGTGPGRGLR